VSRKHTQDSEKNGLKPWLEKCWCIPPKADAEFVYRMENVLELYRLPYDPEFPVICMDEASKQLIGEVRTPIPGSEDQPMRYDYEYERLGVCNQFMFVEPLRGFRKVFVRKRRTMIDWAFCIRELLDVHYPKAKAVRLVLDNLNTHTGASLYEAFSPSEARRLLSRLEFHYTPKHGSWLNRAEIEIGVMNGQCLDRRIAQQSILADEVAAWEQRRNQDEAKIRWAFTVSDARVKLKKIYPSAKN
ncbi:MAG: IS630 family transposase, partial [Planctomycetaceae bacterium]|nr:IS630 family transposase [Planctomycetaceae bacterium]